MTVQDKYVGLSVWTKLVTALHVLALVMLLVEFSGAWIWPPAGAGEISTRPMGGLYRKALWLVLVSVIGLNIVTRPQKIANMFAKVLLPYLPFYLLGVVSILWGVSKVDSTKIVIIWAMVAMVAVAISIELSRNTIFATIRKFFWAVALLSLFVSVFVPELGIGYHYGNPVYKGLFVHKNGFGLFCLIGIILGVSCAKPWSGWNAGFIGVHFVGLMLSGSKSALLVGVIGAAVVQLHVYLGANRYRFTAALGVFVPVVVILAIATWASLGPLAELLGRDPTLSGRTFLWSSYLQSYDQSIFWGEGPGAYTTRNERGIEIAQATRGLHAGTVGQPHNIYVGLLGDVGILGVWFFIFGHGCVAFTSPFISTSRCNYFAAGLAFAILLRGLSEDYEGFVMSLSMLLVILSRGAEFSGPSNRQFSVSSRRSKGHLAGQRLRV